MADRYLARTVGRPRARRCTLCDGYRQPCGRIVVCPDCDYHLIVQMLDARKGAG